MAEEDRIKWNRKYHEKPTLLEERPPSSFVEQFHSESSGKQAIDLACGTGRHTLYLAEHGFSVDAADISFVALNTLSEKASDMDITLLEVDLDTFQPKINHYDLAVMSNYLDRELIKRTAKALKPGAVFIIETYMAHPENEKQDSNPDFLLKPEELKMFFKSGFNILKYEEYWNEPFELYKMRKQRIAAQKQNMPQPKR